MDGLAHQQGLDQDEFSLALSLMVKKVLSRSSTSMSMNPGQKVSLRGESLGSRFMAQLKLLKLSSCWMFSVLLPTSSTRSSQRISSPSLRSVTSSRWLTESYRSHKLPSFTALAYRRMHSKMPTRLNFNSMKLSSPSCGLRSSSPITNSSSSASQLSPSPKNWVIPSPPVQVSRKRFSLMCRSRMCLLFSNMMGMTAKSSRQYLWREGFSLLQKQLVKSSRLSRMVMRMSLGDVTNCSSIRYPAQIRKKNSTPFRFFGERSLKICRIVCVRTLPTRHAGSSSSILILYCPPQSPSRQQL